jgi:hypothetical protein
VPVVFPPESGNESRAARAGPTIPPPKRFQLVWTDPNPAGSVSGYRIYKRDGDQWAEVGVVTSPSWPIDLPPGDTSVAVTAISSNADGGIESVPSEEKALSVARPPSPPRLNVIP